jgi:hypothetical protein
LPRLTRNGVRHALASGSVYEAVRRLGLNRQAAEGLILSLGNLNERIETYTKTGNPDSPAEIRKDLYNNWAGVAAAEWRLEEGSKASLGMIIVNLARSETLMLHRVDLPDSYAEEEGKVDYAQQWLDAHKRDIAKKVVDQLNQRTYP